MRTSIAFVLIAMSLIGLAGPASADVQLPYGRYIGWVQAQGSDRKVALTLDTLIEQPNDPTLFPQLDVIVKSSLGGPKGSEYTSDFYENASYDYTDGVLSLSGANADLTLTLTVTNGDSTTLDGPVFIRSSGVSGVAHFDLYDPNNPDAPNGGIPPVGGDVPALANQYTGTCNGYASYLQLETGKGFNLTDDANHGLVGYAISGRFGIVETNGGLCLAGALCSQRAYHDSNFDLYSGRLTLNSDLGTDICTVTTTKASCQFHMGADAWSCDLAPQVTAIPPGVFGISPYHLTVTAAQKAALPQPNPPANAELVAGLGGDYIGYLFNEATNLYQVMRLNVVAYSSTNNPHNLNLVYVTGGATLHFGDGISSDFFVQPFEPRSFYLAPGFTLESPSSDAFVQVSDWDVGYVKGVWFSHAFGRVGTFELIKGTALPSLDARAVFVPSPQGAFAGPTQPSGTAWRLDITSPNQPAPLATISTLDFVGDNMLVDTSDGGNLTIREPLQRGEYDLYTGALAFTTTEEESGHDRLVTGHVQNDGTPSLIWPGAPQIGMVMDPNHTEQPFTHQ